MDAVVELRAADPHFYWSPKIAVQDVEGQGKSVICIEPIGSGETVIHVPASMLVNVETLTADERLETHELLALELLKRRADSDPWVASMPDDFSFLPVQWPTAEQQQLPERYLKTVNTQSEAISAFAEKCSLNSNDAAWSWLAVNSRCLYWSKGGMTLAPAIDFLNHTADQSLGLSVTTTPMGMSVTTTHHYEPSSELTFCYGPRENGFLLVEYGFTMSRNIWEFVDVTKYIVPIVSGCKHFLEAEGYYGDWTLDAAGEPSFRIEVALAAAQSESLGPVKALINGYDSGERFQEGTSKLMKNVISQALAEARSLRDAAQNWQIGKLYEEYIQIMSRI